MGAKQEMATIAKLQRAAAIGAELERIEGDVTLQRLSREAWVHQCVEIGGFADVAALEAARVTIAGLPYLVGLIERMARRWVQNGQERPSVDGIFGNGDAELAAYAERLSTGLSVEACSAVLSARVAEIYTPEYWGKLTDHSEIEGLTGPLYQELEALDDQLAAELRVRDLAWTADGRPELCAGPVGIAIALDRGTAAEPASAIARAARYAARGVALAA